MFEAKDTADPIRKQMEQLREFNKQSWDACDGDQNHVSNQFLFSHCLTLNYTNNNKNAF